MLSVTLRLHSVCAADEADIPAHLSNFLQCLSRLDLERLDLQRGRILQPEKVQQQELHQQKD